MVVKVVKDMNLLEKEIKNLNETIIEKDKLKEIIKKHYPHYIDTSINWVIYELNRKRIITRLNNREYILGFLKEYKYEGLSDISLDLIERFKKEFNEINIVVYETFILNEWINHLVSRNIVIVEVEKYFIKDIFRYIQNINSHTLFNPSKDDLYLYKDAKIIVNPLVTQAPINKKDKTIKIEKLIVDLFTSDSINGFISEAEKESVIRSIIKKYVVNEQTILAYAKRRKNYDALKDLLDKVKRNED